MATRKTYALDQCPLYKLSSRKRLAQDVFNVDLPFLERLAANENNFRVFTIKQGEKDRQVEVPKVVLERIHRRSSLCLSALKNLTTSTLEFEDVRTFPMQRSTLALFRL